MITSDLHGLTTARHTFYNRRQDADDPAIAFGPWVTTELFDGDGNSVALFITSQEQAEMLRDAGVWAGHLLATQVTTDAVAQALGAGADGPGEEASPSTTKAQPATAKARPARKPATAKARAGAK